MSNRYRTTVAIMGLLIAFASRMAPGDELFLSLTFEQARLQAEQTHKPLFIDFFTTWCGPCKMLDEKTWKDQQVIEWLGQNTIALKIDAEKETELAKQYKVTGFPTLIFIRPDGTELDSLLGYQTADDFIREGKGIIQGKDRLTRAREAVEDGGQENPTLRLRYARALWQSKNNEDALREFLWCFDDGTRHDPDFSAQLPFLTMLIADLGKQYPAARTALLERRDLARKGIVPEGECRPAITTFVTINKRLGLAQENLAFYQQLRTQHPKSKVITILADVLLDDLLSSHKYAEIIEDLDLQARIEEAFGSYHPTTAPATTSPSASTQPSIDPAAQRLAHTVARYYQVLVGLDRHAEADALATRLLRISKGPQVYNELAWGGYLTSAPAEENLKQARIAYDLSEGRDFSIIDTLARVLQARGHKEEAVTLLKQALAKADKPYHKRLLEDCLKSIEG